MASHFALFVDLENCGGKKSMLMDVIERVKIRGDILIMPMFLNLDGEGSDIEVLYVPVNDQEASDSASSSGSI